MTARWGMLAGPIAILLLVGAVLGAHGGAATAVRTEETTVPGPGTAVGSPVVVPPGDPVLVGAGDIADCDAEHDEATARLLDGIGGTVFTLGDNVYTDGTEREFAECYDPTWGRHKARTRPATGNHDYETEGAAAYFAYFGAPAGAPGRGWYGYDRGSWHIVVLNSVCGEVGGCGAGSAQETWLRADLTAHPALCTLAYWHHPRFSSGDHGNSDEVAALWQALFEAGADVVLSGHDHDYERFAPQDPSGALDPARGIVQFVVGTGGKDLRNFDEIQPNSVARDDDTHGVLALTLRPTGYEWAFVPVEGESFRDSGRRSCH